MPCDKCNSERLFTVDAHCAEDCFLLSYKKEKYKVCVPEDIKIGDKDDVCFKYCLDCGKIQGDFPLPPTKLEEND